jgi:hypothetical protein
MRARTPQTYDEYRIKSDTFGLACRETNVLLHLVLILIIALVERAIVNQREVTHS